MTWTTTSLGIAAHLVLAVMGLMLGPAWATSGQVQAQAVRRSGRVVHAVALAKDQAKAPWRLECSDVSPLPMQCQPTRTVPIPLHE